MTTPVHNVRNVLQQYQKALKARSSDKGARGEANPDRVTLSEEGRVRSRMDRIGDSAVKSYLDQALDRTGR